MIVGIVLLVLSPDAGRVGWLVDGVALALITLGGSWATGLLLRRPLSWIALGLGLLVVSYLRARRRPGTRVFPVVFGAGLGVGAFHLTMSVMDVAISTRKLASDRELLAAAWERALSTEWAVSNLVPGLLGLAAAWVGHRFGGLQERRGGAGAKS